MSAITVEQLDKFREFDKGQREEREDQEEEGAIEAVREWINDHPVITTLGVTAIGATVLGYLSTTGALAKYPWLQQAGDKMVSSFAFARQELTAFVANPSETAQRWWSGVQGKCNEWWGEWFPEETKPGTSWPPAPDPNAPVPYEEPPIHGQIGESLPVPHGGGIPAGDVSQVPHGEGLSGPNTFDAGEGGSLGPSPSDNVIDGKYVPPAEKVKDPFVQLSGD